MKVSVLTWTAGNMDDSLRERYRASMLLSGVGDAVGYKNQEWEYCTSGVTIHSELGALGGLSCIVAELPGWPVSDDTVMHLATAEGLNSGKTDRTELYHVIAQKYKECMNDMEGRKPGPSSIEGTGELRPGEPGGYQIPFHVTATGCGAAMRAMCIGLRYPRESEEDELIAYSIECGRMTHHHPTGYLGSLVSALFTAYAIRGRSVESWGRGLVDILPKALHYVESQKLCVQENKEHWQYFGEKWNWYLQERGLQDGKSNPRFPENYGVAERDAIYKTFSMDGWAGRSGHDAPMIAYDALLASKSDWYQLCSRSMFHAGDSDSTGVIAAAWYGAIYGMHESIPFANYATLEYKERLLDEADKLYALAQT